MAPLQRQVTLLLLGMLLVSSVAVAASEYTLSASPSIDIPDQTTTYQDTEYTVGSITRVFAGESVSVQTTVPSNATYDLHFRGPDNQIVSTHSGTGDSTHTLDYFGAGQAGTYVVTVRDKNQIQSVHPVILAGYELTVESPDSVTAGDSATITANLSEQSVEKHSSLDHVELVIGTDTIQIQERMEQQGDGTYRTTVSTADLDTETYNMYVTVRGDAEVRQRPEILGVSDQTTLTITDQSTETTGASSSGSSSNSAGGNTEPTQTATPTPTPTPTATPSPTPDIQTETMTDERPVTPTRTQSTDIETPKTTEGSSETRSEREQGPTTATAQPSDVPEPTIQRSEATTAGSGPGFTVGLGLLAIVLSIVLGVLRR